MKIDFIHLTCQTQNLNNIAGVNLAVRTNYSTRTVFSGKRLNTGQNILQGAV